MLAGLKPLYRRLLDALLPERCLVRQFIAAQVPAIGTGTGLGLDLGAGSSPFRPALQQALPGLHMLASDRQWRSDIDLVGDAATLPLPAASLDLVAAFQVLQYTDTDAVLAEIRRVLRPGGHCLLLCPFLVAGTSSDDRWRWSAEGLAGQVSRAGFTPVAQRRIGGLLLAVTALAAQALCFSRVGWVAGPQGHGNIGARLRLIWNLAVSLPLHLLGRLLLPLDRALPSAHFYFGSIILARRDD